MARLARRITPRRSSVAALTTTMPDGACSNAARNRRSLRAVSWAARSRSVTSRTWLSRTGSSVPSPDTDVVTSAGKVEPSRRR